MSKDDIYFDASGRGMAILDGWEDPPFPPEYLVTACPQSVRLEALPDIDDPLALFEHIAAQLGAALSPFTDPIYTEAMRRMLKSFPEVADPLWPYALQFERGVMRLVVMRYARPAAVSIDWKSAVTRTQ